VEITLADGKVQRSAASRSSVRLRLPDIDHGTSTITIQLVRVAAEQVSPDRRGGGPRRGCARGPRRAGRAAAARDLSYAGDLAPKCSPQRDQNPKTPCFNS